MLNLDSFTKDPDIFKKLLIGSVLLLTGFGLIPLAGWLVAATRRNIEEEDPYLPPWDDFGSYFRDGLKLAGILIIWALPAMLPVLLGALAGFFLPGMFASQDDALLVILVLNLCVAGIVLIYTIPLVIFTPVLIGHYAKTGSVQAVLKPRQIFEIFRSNASGFVIAGLLGNVLASALGSFGMVLCFVGVLPATVAGYGVMGQLYGKAYRQSSAGG